MATKSEKLQDVLTALRQETGEIEASAVVSIEGLMIAADMPKEMNKDSAAAMSAAMLSVGKRAVKELACGQFKRILVGGSEGSAVVQTAGDGALLAVQLRQYANLGLVFLEMQRAADEIAALV